jgi:hypothetical protein
MLGGIRYLMANGPPSSPRGAFNLGGEYRLDDSLSGLGNDT